MKIRQIFLCAVCLLMTGCSAVDMSVETMLTPPKLTAEQNEIYQALTNSGGEQLKLKYPRSGDYRSAFVLHNIDDEPDKEAMVFYETKTVQSGEGALRLKFLDKFDGKWQAVYDLACVGSEVDSISFTKLGNQGAVDIIVRYSMLNQTEKYYSIINYDEGVPKELYGSLYSCLEVMDLTSDGYNELVSVVTDKANQVSTAMMFANTEEGFHKLSEVQLSNGLGDYVNVTKGMLNENTKALFLDYSYGGGQYGTDVLYCYGDRILTPDSIGSNADSSIINRITNDYMADIHCFDIDGDSFVEIPSTMPLPGYEILTKPEQLCAVKWYTIIDNNYTQEHYSYYSSKFNFAMLFPSRWIGVVSAVVNYPANEIVFISYDAAKGLVADETTELMRIRTVAKDDVDGINAAAGMKLLGESDEVLYYYSVTNGYKTGKLALTESELENSFIVLDN